MNCKEKINYYCKWSNRSKSFLMYATFNGVIFVKKTKADYYTALKNEKYTTNTSLHHAVYMYYNNIDNFDSQKYCIHHIDHRKHNNCIKNLQKLTFVDHGKLHASKMSDETKRKMSESKKGKWAGKNNPRYGNGLKGANHGRYIDFTEEQISDIVDMRNNNESIYNISEFIKNKYNIVCSKTSITRVLKDNNLKTINSKLFNPTLEQDDFLLFCKNNLKLKIPKITEMFNEKYNVNFSRSTIGRRIKKIS